MLIAASALLFAACGGNDDGGGSTGGASTSSTSSGDTSGGKSGGTLSAYYTSSPDYMDPALSYTQEGWTALWNVYTPLLTYKHAEGAEGADADPGSRRGACPRSRRTARRTS